MTDNIENIDENSKWISIKFVNWASSDHLELKLGKSYLIRNAIVSEYNGNYQINFNIKTVIEEIKTEGVEIIKSKKDQ